MYDDEIRRFLGGVFVVGRQWKPRAFAPLLRDDDSDDDGVRGSFGFTRPCCFRGVVQRKVWRGIGGRWDGVGGGQLLRDERFFGPDDKWSPLPGEFRRGGRWKIDGLPTRWNSTGLPGDGAAGHGGFRDFSSPPETRSTLIYIRVCQVQPQRHGLRRDSRMFNNEEQNCAINIVHGAVWKNDRAVKT